VPDSSATRHDCVVVGAGPAGLAASAALTALDVDHVVLDRGQAGQTWRSQRWDSFRLNTPGWMSQLLHPSHEQEYLDRSQVWAALDSLAASVGDLRTRTDVVGLEPDAGGDGFRLDTSQGPLRARSVVVATGDQNVPRLPAMSAQLPHSLVQVHTSHYRCADALPDGPVLVVGTGQSGCQIAADLLAAGREVVVSTSSVGRVPTPYRGRESLYWLVACGFYDQATAQVDPVVRAMPIPLLAPAGRPLGLPTLARRGAQLVGRPTALVDGRRLEVDDSAAANVAAGEAFAARLRTIADEFIVRTGVDAPAPDADPDSEPVTLAPVASVDLRRLGAVVWCTGFGGDFRWLPEPVSTRGAAPVLDGVAASVAGLYAVGLRWLTRRRSSILHGFPVDAAEVADRVKAHLG